ncbi:hypothetical protein [Kibdelosporangium phytohabitans]|uniref:Carboxypeptidase regulatory-like domain-containing protein n=1 Tax=Kibdelosporangium phytohabitans TaxID=860235 RepID=A0A0N9HV02_9PSEU|nr:hypothetical protein [Kibdelosporangium phytohabitans]ALG07374.1 hypothetical protein AOZ06_10965 [Kibdelosporangium phytohabitans]MBE1471748.1 hypothetical protein [Kibdelosporangium phytohabitans]
MTAPDEPLDGLDHAILAGVKDMWRQADPVPADLLDRIKFAIDLETVDLEVMRLTELARPAATRGDEQSRLITFDSETVTIMVSIRQNPDGTIRVDGWLTPAGRHPIELRTAGGTAATVSDEDGRFVLDPVCSGLVQLIVRPTGTTRTVTTPSISL